MKKITAVLMVMVLTAALWGCAAPSGESEVTVLAAASLTDVCGELKTVYEEENEGITINFSFGGSGALQTQIEEGAPADMFISAADTQMNALLAQGLIEEDSVTELLENKAVLIVPEGNPADINSFEDVPKADLIGIGEVSSVPVGQYSMEIFENLGIWEQVREKANFGGDSDTLAAITGSVTEAYYGVPTSIRKRAITFLDERLLEILLKFESRYPAKIEDK